MGTLVYADHGRYALDDRALTHLKRAVELALNASGGFVLNIPADPATGQRSEALWIHPSITVRFDIVERADPLDEVWIRSLVRGAETDRGMRIDGRDPR